MNSAPQAGTVLFEDDFSRYAEGIETVPYYGLRRIEGECFAANIGDRLVLFAP